MLIQHTQQHHSDMFRHYCAIFREFLNQVVALPKLCYTAFVMSAYSIWQVPSVCRMASLGETSRCVPVITVNTYTYIYTHTHTYTPLTQLTLVLFIVATRFDPQRVITRLIMFHQGRHVLLQQTVPDSRVELSTDFGRVHKTAKRDY